MIDAFILISYILYAKIMICIHYTLISAHFMPICDSHTWIEMICIIYATYKFLKTFYKFSKNMQNSFLDKTDSFMS